MKGHRTLEAPKLLGITWPFIAVVVFQVALGSLSLYTLSAVRAYVAGESLWSKAQKDAIYYLNLYAETRDDSTYQRYRQAITVPQGDHQLREVLDQPNPDLDAARRAVLQGGNHPDDVERIIWFYRNFRNISYMQTAIDYWDIGDDYLAKLDVLAGEMRQSFATGAVDAQAVSAWKARIVTINEGVTPAAKAFSDALGEGSRMLLRVLLITNLLTAMFLITIAWRRSSKLLAQRQAFASALQEEKERAQITLQAIGDAVITTDVEGSIGYMNPAAEQLTHWQSGQAQGLPLSALFSLVDEQAEEDGSSLVEQVLSGSLKGGAEHARLIQRLDGSTVSINLVGSPIVSDGQVSGIVLVLHDMTQERQYIANLSWQATHDALTGLANRREFEYRLEQALNGLARQAGRHSLMFLDLDQFKLVNDTCGHAAGDELLRHICAVLQSGLREGDTLARLGVTNLACCWKTARPTRPSALPNSYARWCRACTSCGRGGRSSPRSVLAWCTWPRPPVPSKPRCAPPTWPATWPRKRGATACRCTTPMTASCPCALVKWPGSSACMWPWKKTASVCTPRKLPR